jgi:hypothetical protein
LGLVQAHERQVFNERIVVAVEGSPEEIDRIRLVSGAIAELRRLREGAHAFTGMRPAEQMEWTEELLGRIKPPDGDAPAVCILDTGVTREHPLLAPLLSEDDWHAYRPLGEAEWPRGDNSALRDPHGTAMAGLAAYGDLQGALTESGEVVLAHRLESVRILPPRGANPRRLYGPITREATALAEGAAPFRDRIYCMAVTSDEEECKGRPTSWSAEVDSLALGNMDERPRLFVLSAGNIPGAEEPTSDYLERCDGKLAEEPAQAWNALVVGACTFLHRLSDKTWAGWQPVAPVGDLSPVTRTSVGWEGKWPVRPDVVFEGGNLARSPDGTEWRDPDDFGLLTTYCAPTDRLFDLINATSAASAQVAHMAGRLMAEFPDFWPETLRGLIVHSAEWSERVRRKFDAADKTGKGMLLRAYGYGVPDLRRALASARDDVTIIVQDEMEIVDAEGKMPEMRFYELPWPTDVLQEIEGDVRLRVTLSYFIEPNPARRGKEGRFRYRSHGLRFQLKRPGERERAFLARINKADWDDDYEGPEDREDNWELGVNQRNNGSLHSDFWEGPGAELALRDRLAVIPVGGWWKYRKKKPRKARYSLMISLSAPGSERDIHSAVRLRLETLAAVNVAPTRVEV